VFSSFDFHVSILNIIRYHNWEN